MVLRTLVVEHGSSSLELDYDTDDGLEVLKFQLFSLTSIPPDQQKILRDKDNCAVLDDSDIESISTKLRLISIDENEEATELVNSATNLTSDEELARLLQEEEDAQQQVVPRIQPYVHQVFMYEDPLRQEEARKTFPLDIIEEKAMVALAREGNLKPSKDELDHAFLLQLLFWFKRTFRWVNAPSCRICNNKTINQGMGIPEPLESHYGASRVELYRCTSCMSITRFPRYNDPLKLLETKEGRCGEWANCFTLYCRAFGYESRLVLDFTDHVWTECFSRSLERWIHLDPCEGIYDNPLLYEAGWKKNLNYVIAVSKDGVYDVTKRYTRKWHEVLSRRHLTSEITMATVISGMTKDIRKSFTPDMLLGLQERDRNESLELERCLSSKDVASISLPGRQSGDKQWRLSRSEFGSDDHHSLSSSCCPVRKCVDEHVTNIYNAFYPIVNEFVEQDFKKTEALEVMGTLKSVLVGLKNSPFKTRKTRVSAVTGGVLFRKMLPSFGQLFEALSLKRELHADGTVEICISSDPVKTSLALPVLFNALDGLINDINSSHGLNKDSLSLPTVKVNRLSSGFVQASGEELPFGKATSAFDGTRLSKWEEPTGAKGCWITYKVPNERLELVAYEFMSANDAPERDPMDWILEGSEDGGSTWKIIDEQTLQRFNNRFERKVFEIKRQTFQANAFRFRFLAVQDAKSNSRFQIGSIDLYKRQV